MDIIDFIENFFERSKNSLETMKAKHGGKIETTYQKLTKVTKKWTSEDGSMTREEVSYINGELNDKEIRIQELLAEKETALKNEDYERCAAIKKELESLKES